jgi:hypothetical protein
MSWHLAATLGVVMGLGLAVPDQQRSRQPVIAEVGRPFTVTAGGRVKFKNEPLEIGFTRVVMDSRCPKGAECITAGVAVVTLWVSNGGARSAQEVRTDPPAAARIVQGPYTITLEKLAPYPELGRQIAPRYVATFVVRRP